MFNAVVMQVIRTDLVLRGKGIEGDPIRRITQYWSLDGELLAEVDPIPASDSPRPGQIIPMEKR